MEKTKEKYSYWIGVKKSLIKTGIIAIPIIATMLIQSIPADVKNMTVGGVCIYVTNLAVNYLKNKNLGK